MYSIVPYGCGCSLHVSRIDLKARPAAKQKLYHHSIERHIRHKHVSYKCIRSLNLADKRGQIPMKTQIQKTTSMRAKCISAVLLKSYLTQRFLFCYVLEREAEASQLPLLQALAPKSLCPELARGFRTELCPRFASAQSLLRASAFIP